MKYYLYIGEIQGLGKVPMDMLRYDQAFPYREIDSAEMERRANLEYVTGVQVAAQSVLIATKRITKQIPWTLGRWQSFNRVVKHIETREVSR